MTNKLSKEQFRELVLRDQEKYKKRKTKDYEFSRYVKYKKYNKKKLHKKWYKEKYTDLGTNYSEMRLHNRKLLTSKSI